MSGIQIRNVSKVFNGVSVVRDLSLDIAEGEFVALLGPSGCGKTTTMNMIAGIEEVTQGAILFEGKDLSSTPIQRRNIGFVFQNYAVFTHLTVYKNLAYGLEVRKTEKSEIERRVKAMAKRMGLSQALDKPASSLSVNEMQKLAIGRSAVVEPRIFLLDEPLSNLDASFRAYMRAELKILQREFGQTMIYVTHDQIEAMSLADKIAIIDRGKLMQYGSPLDVYSDPANRFVANFVGTPRINLVDGNVTGQAGKLSLAASHAKIALGSLVGSYFNCLADGHPGSIGIRPQDIYVGDRRAAEDIELSGVVAEIERTGPTRLAHLDIGGTRLSIADDRDQIRTNDHISFHLAADKCLAFDAATGNRLKGAYQ
ncbi:ABC transporter ATP-binding protein [Rhizobium rhizogenes]|uniref:ABC transporter ATP-binding protein n=1 Tax=Rhizobium rhizogenes TaxID=359 RepID=UPI00157235B8|nr:ABC transporter ATP-binding protein [Rhizobium rhizogenes]NTH22959.1 ABC transporter ATP-binding protein [Rhizobium rhizogenes]NTH35989.1 ABC transporter ATP-binding protein [Rhizobium rhizogenes]